MIPNPIKYPKSFIGTLKMLYLWFLEGQWKWWDKK